MKLSEDFSTETNNSKRYVVYYEYFDSEEDFHTALKTDSLEEAKEMKANLLANDNVSTAWIIDTETKKPITEGTNPLEDASKKHKKHQKGMSPFGYLNPDAGDVETSVAAFNHAMGNSCEGGECMGESLDGSLDGLIAQEHEYAEFKRAEEDVDELSYWVVEADEEGWEELADQWHDIEDAIDCVDRRLSGESPFTFKSSKHCWVERWVDYVPSNDGYDDDFDDDEFDGGPDSDVEVVYDPQGYKDIEESLTEDVNSNIDLMSVAAQGSIQSRIFDISTDEGTEQMAWLEHLLGEWYYDVDELQISPNEVILQAHGNITDTDTAYMIKDFVTNEFKKSYEEIYVDGEHINTPEYTSLFKHVYGYNPFEDEDEIKYDRRAVEHEYDLEDGELDGVSIRDAERIIGEEIGALDRFMFNNESLTEGVNEYGEPNYAEPFKVIARVVLPEGYEVLNSYAVAGGVANDIESLIDVLCELDNYLDIELDSFEDLTEEELAILGTERCEVLETLEEYLDEDLTDKMNQQIDDRNANYEADRQATRDMRQELAKQGIATDTEGNPLNEEIDDEDYDGYEDDEDFPDDDARFDYYLETAEDLIAEIGIHPVANEILQEIQAKYPDTSLYELAEEFEEIFESRYDTKWICYDWKEAEEFVKDVEELKKQGYELSCHPALYGDGEGNMINDFSMIDDFSAYGFKERSTKPVNEEIESELAVLPNEDAKCECGNASHLDGFHPCNKNGEIVEPDNNWEGCYKCARCGKIYIGQEFVAPKPPYIEGLNIKE